VKGCQTTHSRGSSWHLHNAWSHTLPAWCSCPENMIERESCVSAKYMCAHLSLCEYVPDKLLPVSTVCTYVSYNCAYASTQHIGSCTYIYNVHVIYKTSRGSCFIVPYTLGEETNFNHQMWGKSSNLHSTESNGRSEDFKICSIPGVLSSVTCT
jgi:hypothetical protein